MSAEAGNRCPKCHNRVVRARDGQLTLFMSNVIVKSDGKVEGTCSDCKQRIAVPQAALDLLRKAVMLVR